jgi:LuxR family transcriptional regulator, maltose regulon positive regulatory protein
VHRFPTTKLRAPRNAADAIARPRLEALLDRARGALRATLLMAPAGYGKTTLVASWATRQGPAPAWFTVDPGDDPGDGDVAAAEARATAWLHAALDAARPVPVLDDDVDDGASDPSALAAAVERTAWRGVVVIDDVHHLGRAAGAALATWVERAPEGVHTVLLARQAPPVPVARWLARGELEVFGVDALRLDAAEGRALAGRLLPTLSHEHADALVARVEGWPAGVQLAARTLRGKADPADVIERFTGTDRYVLSFLTEEVLLRLPDDLHEAAVLLAGPPRLCAGLVDAVTLRDDGAALLARLEEGEAFLERLDAVDEDGPWFRFPDFFRDLLAHRLALTHPDLAARLAQRAAAWWAARAERPAHPPPSAAGTTTGGAGPDALTERERQVVVLLAAGAATKAIARELGLSPNTVKTHTRHVFEKLGARNRTEAAAAARRRGLL